MTGLGPTIASLVAGAAVAAGGLVGAGSGAGSGGTASGAAGTTQGNLALVIDASLARNGRDLIDPRLRDLPAELRLPRTAEEAQTNVRYLAEVGDRVVVAGPLASAAAADAGIAAQRAAGLPGALAALGR